MLIIDERNKQETDSILIMLTRSEYKEMLDKLEGLDIENGNHFHVADESYSREVKIAVYTPENMHYWTPEIQRLIESQK